MRKIWEWIKSNPNRTMFLVPILLVAVISISHVVSWYNIANPLSWAIYLSIAIEVGAMTALVAATNKIKGGVWFMFGLVTLIQMIGNIFYSYKEIDPNGELFKSWVELTGPVWEMIGSDPSDIPAMKRWLSFLEGGLLPVISLTSLHFFVKYEDKKEASSTPNANRRALCNIPNTDPPTPYHSLVAEGTRGRYRFNEYVVFHRLIPSFAYDNDGSKFLHICPFVKSRNARGAEVFLDPISFPSLYLGTSSLLEQ